MMARLFKWVLSATLTVVVGYGLFWAFRPSPVSVDLAEVTRGALETAITDEGIARVRDVFRVSAPVGGRLQRIDVEAGERVRRDLTIIASLQPPDPSLLDQRTRRELEAGVAAAKAGVSVADAEVNRAQSALRFVQSDFDRADRLAKTGVVSEQVHQKATSDLAVARATVQQAEAAKRLRESELASAEARLLQPRDAGMPRFGEMAEVDIMAPVDGVVLKVLTRSEQVVPAGAPLVEIGDSSRMEIVANLLSSDAVQLRPGMRASISDWGGARNLSAAVRRIEPTANTKVSALGIEEQRVNVVFDILDPVQDWLGLGHEYRVMIRITTWRGEDLVKVPVGALFRRGSAWMVYKTIGGRAVLSEVILGRQNAREAEVTSGLAAGDVVVLHPSDRVVPDVRLQRRD